MKQPTGDNFKAVKRCQIVAAIVLRAHSSARTRPTLVYSVPSSARMRLILVHVVCSTVCLDCMSDQDC